MRIDTSKGSAIDFNGQGQGVCMLMQAKKHIYLSIQYLNMSTDKYLLQFKALMSVLGTYGKSFAEPALIKAELVTAGVMAYSRWRHQWLRSHPSSHDVNQPHKVLHALCPLCSPSAGIIRLMQNQ